MKLFMFIIKLIQLIELINKLVKYKNDFKNALNDKKINI